MNKTPKVWPFLKSERYCGWNTQVWSFCESKRALFSCPPVLLFSSFSSGSFAQFVWNLIGHSETGIMTWITYLFFEACFSSLQPTLCSGTLQRKLVGASLRRVTKLPLKGTGRKSWFESPWLFASSVLCCPAQLSCTSSGAFDSFGDYVVA